MITHSTNIVEHPELVAERLLRFAEIVGRENVMAGTDCGFSQSPLARPRPSDDHVGEAQVAGRRRADRHGDAVGQTSGGLIYWHSQSSDIVEPEE